jgi:hypothetical protein
MSTVDYIPFATGGGASVMSQPNYITNAPNGVVAGIADPTFANKSWRQSSMIGAAVANFISNILGISVLDDGNLTTLVNNLTAAIEQAAASGIAIGMGAPTNLQIAAIVGSNQLTVSLLGTNGSAPSASNPIGISFRDATIANGEVVARTVTAALSFTVGSGPSNTMGAVNGVPFRLWVVGFDNAGTVALGLINCSVAGQIFSLNEDAPQTSQSGTSGGSTAGLYYASTSALSAKSIRILGYLEWSAGLVTAGTWAVVPTKIQLFGPGQRKPGDVVQSNTTSSTTAATTSSATFAALSSGATVAITPTSTINQIRVKSSGTMRISASNVIAQLQPVRGSTLIGNPAEMDIGTGVGALNGQVSLDCWDAPASVSAQTYSYQGKISGGTLSYPPANTGVFLEVQELMG